jgi:hypothetical protein
MTQLLAPSQATFDGTMASINLDIRLAILHCLRRGGSAWFIIGDSPQVRIQTIIRDLDEIQFIRCGRNEWEALPVGATLYWAERQGGGR